MRDPRNGDGDSGRPTTNVKLAPRHVQDDEGDSPITMTRRAPLRSRSGCAVTEVPAFAAALEARACSFFDR
jgi:hypothetical protein